MLLYIIIHQDMAQSSHGNDLVLCKDAVYEGALTIASSVSVD
jgi:hypothetical protein